MGLRIPEEVQYAGMTDENSFVDWYMNEFMPENLDEFIPAVKNSDLVEMLRWARRKALEFAFDDFPSMTHFVTLMWKIGPSFYEFPGFREISLDKSTPAPLRIEKFYNEVTEAQATAAIMNIDDQRWFTRP